MSEPTPETEAGLGKTREHQAVRQENATHVVGSSTAFIVCMILLASFYIVLIVLMLLANIGYLAFSGKGLESLLAALRSPEVRYAISLSLISCSITAVLALWVSVLPIKSRR